MRFRETPLNGAFVVDLDRLEDERGFFARSFCEKEFSAQGLTSRFVQCNVSFNKRAGTLRGMHYQEAPHEEDKLVRCTMGAVYDIIVDIRPGSPTHLKSFGIELSAANRTALFIPHGFAHGFQTLRDDTEVFYQMSEFFHPGSARGLRWDDPALALRWPVAAPILSDKDRGYPLLAKGSA
jgi:dTDP-4-dehydrorhamnose 3,5-epimerase